MVKGAKLSAIFACLLAGITTFAGLILSGVTVSADETVSDVTITIPVACNIVSTIDSPHTATIYNGTYAENIGTTTFKVLCNDNTGFAIYAIGYSGEEYGNTEMLAADSTHSNIATGLATSGDISAWAMKLTPISGTYTPIIESDTNGSFANYHIVPDTYTKVATFASSTDFTIGSSLQSTYRVFIGNKQSADTYNGKVKYTLVHPDDANPPVDPRFTAYLETGQYINNLIPVGRCLEEGDVYDEENDEWNTECIRYDTRTPIREFKKATSLPDNFVADENNTISTADSPKPVYFFPDQTDDGVYYYYSEANTIYMNSDSSYMFIGAYELSNIEALSNWNTSSVTNMSGMFSQASSLTNIDALSNWDTSSVTDMHQVFSGTSLTNIDALSNWDTSSVTDMRSMFSGTSSLTNIDGVSNWNTSSVTDMSGIFSSARSLTNIDALSSWDTSKVTEMSFMFVNTTSLTNIDALSSWDTSSVTKMTAMFRSASSLTNIDGASNWDTSSVTPMSQMFKSVSSLTDISGARNWNTKSLTSISEMFYKVNGIDATVLNNWNVSNIGSGNNRRDAFTCPVAKQPCWYNNTSCTTNNTSNNTNSTNSTNGTFSYNATSNSQAITPNISNTPDSDTSNNSTDPDNTRDSYLGPQGVKNISYKKSSGCLLPPWLMLALAAILFIIAIILFIIIKRRQDEDEEPRA